MELFASVLLLTATLDLASESLSPARESEGFDPLREEAAALSMMAELTTKQIK